MDDQFEAGVPVARLTTIDTRIEQNVGHDQGRIV